MFKITIEKRYKFKYTIYRNRREIISFHSKKLARDYLYKLKYDLDNLSRAQTLFNIYAIMLRSGDSMVVYTSKRQTLGDSLAEDFKDYFEIKREFNENY